MLYELGHSMASLQEGLAAVQRGASFITHLFNAMLPVSLIHKGLLLSILRLKTALIIIMFIFKVSSSRPRVSRFAVIRHA